MPVLDDRTEALSPAQVGPRRRVYGMLDLLAGIALSSTVMQVDVEPGTFEADGKVGDYGSERIDCQVGVTLADLSEAITAIVVYYLPATNRFYRVVVDGAVALTTAGAVAPTADTIEAALPTGAIWAVAHDVKFARSSTTVTATIDRSRRAYGVDPDRKAPATGTNGDSSDDALYRWVGRMLIWEGLAATIADGDLLTDMPVPPIHGRFSNLHAVAQKAITTAAKTTSLNLEIGSTNVTGTLVYASTKALGVVGSQALSGANTFAPGDVFSLEAASTTAFVEGEIAVYADVEELIGN